MDPDVVETNVDFIRRSALPRWQRVLLALTIICTWRLLYYAPSTLIQLRRKERGLPPSDYSDSGFLAMFNPFTEPGRDFWRRCLLPNGVLRFVLIPLAMIPFGLKAVLNLLIVQVLAEILGNAYSWALITSSHTAHDLHRFDHVPRNKAEWYLHQLLGTANYSRGSSFSGWLQMWVNYQIEHHLCPNLTLLQLERISPEIERVCASHGLPYVNEPLPRRFRKMFSILIGDSDMQMEPETANIHPASGGE